MSSPLGPESYEARWRNVKALRNVLTGGIVAIPVALIVLTALRYSGPAYFGLAGAAAVLALASKVTRDRLRELEEAYYQRQYEEQVQRAEGRDKAETLFLKHEFELRRYYAQTLRHADSIFYVGVGALIVGLGVFVVAFEILEGHLEADTTTKIIVGSLAALSGFMTNYVARIYIEMHRAAINSVSDFHNRLVRTQDAHFGHLLLNELDGPLREQKLADAAVSLFGAAPLDPGSERSADGEDASA